MRGHVQAVRCSPSLCWNGNSEGRCIRIWRRKKAFRMCGSYGVAGTRSLEMNKGRVNVRGPRPGSSPVKLARYLPKYINKGAAICRASLMNIHTFVHPGPCSYRKSGRCGRTTCQGCRSQNAVLMLQESLHRILSTAVSRKGWMDQRSKEACIVNTFAVYPAAMAETRIGVISMEGSSLLAIAAIHATIISITAAAIGITISLIGGKKLDMVRDLFEDKTRLSVCFSRT